MSMLQLISNQPGFERIKLFYYKEFPFEVRSMCAEFIENRIQSEANITDDDQLSVYAKDFILNLIERLEKEREKLIQPDQLPWIDATINNFRLNIDNARRLYETIRAALSQEHAFLQTCSSSTRRSHVYVTDDSLDEKLNQLLQISSNFQIGQSIESIQDFIEILTKVKTVTVHRLDKWKRHQALVKNGAKASPDTPDDFQNWFEKLAHSISTTREFIASIKSSTVVTLGMAEIATFDSLCNHLITLLRELILTGFVIVEQPPQVLKTNSKVQATVRHLLPNYTMLKGAPVTVSILSEAQAQAQHNDRSTIHGNRSGVILNNCGNLRQNDQGILMCHFGRLQLDSIRRPEKRPSECVMNEKFTLLFTSVFQCNDVCLDIWVMSLPIVVTVHGNQETQAWATITWDNAFSEIGRVPFGVADHVSWSNLASALQMKFNNDTKCCLTVENLKYLQEKVQRGRLNDRLVTWSLFCKELIGLQRGKKFTLWDWFYAAMKLTKDHLLEPWKDGLIVGFINKQRAEEMLLKCAPGTFLLRFSDSEPGGISVCWVKQKTVREKQIKHVAPFTSQDLRSIPISNRIKNLRQLITLYPDIPKDKAFQKFYRPSGKVPRPNYVRFETVTVVNDEDENESVLDYNAGEGTSTQMGAESPNEELGAIDHSVGEDTSVEMDGEQCNALVDPETINYELSSIDFESPFSTTTATMEYSYAIQTAEYALPQAAFSDDFPILNDPSAMSICQNWSFE